MPYTALMGIIKKILAVLLSDHCGACGKPGSECSRNCPAAIEEDAVWFHEIK